jgi:hypothetical protein
MPDDVQCERERVAHHEAGHAVAAFLLRVPFEHVSIASNAFSMGHLRLTNRRRPKGMERNYKLGIIGLAGLAAERRFSPTGVQSNSHEDDWPFVRDLSFEWGGSGKIAQALVDLWTLQAEELIGGQWKLVQKLAAALMLQETLDFMQVTEVLFGFRSSPLNSTTAEEMSEGLPGATGELKKSSPI